MSSFKAEVHQIRFRLGLRSRPRLGRLRRSPRLLAKFEGLTSKRRERKGGNRYKGEGKGQKGEKGERKEQEEGRGKGRE